MKPYSSMNRTELNTAVDEKKALPDMVLKRIIFEAKANMLETCREMMYNALRNNGTYNPNDAYRFRTAIAVVWYHINEMSRDNGYINLNSMPEIGQKSDFERMQDLTYGKKLKVKTLIRLSEYVTYCLHKLNLTDLRISNETDEHSEDTY